MTNKHMDIGDDHKRWKGKNWHVFLVEKLPRGDAMVNSFRRSRLLPFLFIFLGVLLLVIIILVGQQSQKNKSIME